MVYGMILLGHYFSLYCDCFVNLNLRNPNVLSIDISLGELDYTLLIRLY